jgi:hypothetical protein
MTIVDMLEATLKEKGFEKVVDLETLDKGAQVLYGDIRQYRRDPFGDRRVLGIVDSKKGIVVPSGPACEKVAVYYPKPNSSASDIMIHYQTCFGCFEFNKYGYFDKDGNPLNGKPNDESGKNHAKEIQEAILS